MQDKFDPDQAENKGEDEHATLWELATRDVKPLAGRKNKPVQKPVRKPATQKTRPAKQAVQEDENVKQDVLLQAAEIRENDFSGVDRRTDEKLRRGRMSIDAVLDLHGCNRTEAYESLNKFLKTSQAAGKRCVLVVTGKGRNDGTGVLKQSFPDWISEAQLKHLVLQYYPARPHHGGSGAFYVLLRRIRSS